METSADRIKEFQRLIAVEESKIKNCKHDFGEPFSNPETVKEPYGSRFVQMGSDSWSEPLGYRDVQKPRWTQKCKLCGHEQHTNKLKPVHKPEMKPDFGSCL